MKFAADVLVEIVSIVQNGLIRQADVSHELREIDVVENDEGALTLSAEYLLVKGRVEKDATL